jgi:hypothetical protein
MYQGYYYELNGKYFVGKEFNPNSKELVLITQEIENIIRRNQFRFDSLLLGVLNNTQPQSYIYDHKSKVRFFTAKTSNPPYTIKEIDETTYKQLQSNTLQTTVSLNYDGGFDEKELNEAEKKIPGLRTFVINNFATPTQDL